MIRGIVSFVLMAFLLVGCSGEDQGELRQWMKDETKDLRGRIPPLPQVKPMPTATDPPEHSIVASGLAAFSCSVAPTPPEVVRHKVAMAMIPVIFLNMMIPSTQLNKIRIVERTAG